LIYYDYNIVSIFGNIFKKDSLGGKASGGRGWGEKIIGV